MGELDILGTGALKTRAGRAAARAAKAELEATELAAVRAEELARWRERSRAKPIEELLCPGGAEGGCYATWPHVHARIGGRGFPVDPETGQWVRDEQVA
jgi:hypothetical protein